MTYKRHGHVPLLPVPTFPIKCCISTVIRNSSILSFWHITKLSKSILIIDHRYYYSLSAILKFSHWLLQKSAFLDTLAYHGSVARYDKILVLNICTRCKKIGSVNRINPRPTGTPDFPQPTGGGGCSNIISLVYHYITSLSRLLSVVEENGKNVRKLVKND